MTPHAEIKLKVAIPSRHTPGHIHPVGASGIVVEPLGPDAWLVEVRVADDDLVGGAWFETLDVYRHEFELVNAQPEHEGDAVRRYQNQYRVLVVKRALGLLSTGDEAEVTEILGGIWHRLSADQQREIEAWLEAERRPAPNSEIHADAIEVEADDITVAPRSAA